MLDLKCQCKTVKMKSVFNLKELQKALLRSRSFKQLCPTLLVNLNDFFINVRKLLLNVLIIFNHLFVTLSVSTEIRVLTLIIFNKKFNISMFEQHVLTTLCVDHSVYGLQCLWTSVCGPKCMCTTMGRPESLRVRT